MARNVPASPAHCEAALDAALAKALRPASPQGLTARIVAKATALPQLPADGPVETEPAAEHVSATVIPFQAAQEVPAGAPRPATTRRVLLAGGLAAMAATVVAVVLLGQTGQQAVPTSAPVPVMAQRQNTSAPMQVAPVVAPDTRWAAAPSGRKIASPAAASAPTNAPAVPVAAPSVAPDAQLASTVGPAPHESAGPTSDPSPRPNPRGLMGPPAPQQGWAFSGGIPSGGTLPGGQSLPSQTTGSAPPPPPPPGH